MTEENKGTPQKFRFVGNADITHLNTRKEGPDESKELAVDLKLCAVADAGILDLLGDGIADFLYMAENPEAVRNTMLGPITFKHEIEDYRLDMLGQTHYGVKVKKISAEPKDGRVVSITFGVSFKPSGDEVAQLAEYLQEPIEITLEPANNELDLGGDCANANDADDPLYMEALNIVLKNQRASISLVQRELRIGYNRAARLVEKMQAEGYVSGCAADGSRKVLRESF